MAVYVVCFSLDKIQREEQAKHVTNLSFYLYSKEMLNIWTINRDKIRIMTIQRRKTKISLLFLHFVNNRFVISIILVF